MRHDFKHILQYIGLDQALATPGPRATYGPQSTLMWPGGIFEVILIAKFTMKKH